MELLTVRPLSRAALFVSAALAMSACSGGSGGGGGNQSSASTTPATTMNGVVAIGSALAQANLTIVDVNGKNAQSTSAADGTYSVSVGGLTAPLLIVSNDPNGISTPMYSVVASLVPPTAGQPLTVNITPLTTAVSAELTPDGNPSGLTASGALGKMVTATTVSSSVSKLNAILASLLAQNGLTQSFDPIGGAFTPNQTGADAVIDSVAVTPAPAGGLQITSIADMGVSVALNQNTSTGTVLSATPYPANYLNTLLTQLGQCLGGTTSACSTAIDAAYMESGVNNFQKAHGGISAQGVTITGATTLAYFPGGTFPNVSGESALVHLNWTNGTPNFSTTLVQHLPNGSWDIIGNQVQYHITASTFLMSTTLLNPASGESRYQTGLQVTIPTGSGSGNPSNMASASVTGPGLNGTAWMEPRSAVGNTSLSFTPNVLTAAPTGGATSYANTSLYRWSWEGFGGTSIGDPSVNKKGFFYGSTPIAAASLPQPYSTYMVTLYDSTGARIGSPQIVLNTTLPMTVSAAANVIWQTLSSTTTNAFLSPDGSLAGSQGTLGIAWSTNGPTGNEAPEVSSIEVQSYSPTAEVDGFWPGPASFQSSGNYTETATAGMNGSGVQQCSTACPFLALGSSGYGRNIELNWSAQGISYLNVFEYDD